MAGDADIERARDLVAASSRVTVLTGAGISTDSGIPDFRGPQGVWTTNPEAEKLSTLHHYLADPQVRVRAWRSRLDSPTWQAQPNPGHRALVDLERRHDLELIVTQNVDGLHQAAGSSDDYVVEIHGSMRWVVCWSCGRRLPMDEILDRVRAGEADPACTATVNGSICGGILKSATISFGQDLVREDLERAERAAMACDLLLAVGTSLAVYPAAGLAPLAQRAGARLVIVNAQPTDYDDIANVVVRTPISEALPAIIG